MFCWVRPRGYKTFFILNSAVHEIYPAHKAVISRINISSESLKARNIYIFQHIIVLKSS